MCIAKKLAKQMLDLIDEIEKEYKKTDNELYITSQQTQDLLHEIELSTFNAARGYLLAKQLQEIRQHRRQMKDDKNTLKVLNDFVNRHKNIKNELRQAINSIEAKERQMDSRHYIPRILDNLTIAVITEQNQ